MSRLRSGQLGPVCVVLGLAGSVGLLAACLAREAPVGLLGLPVPLALLWSSYEKQTRSAGEARLYAELAQGLERVTGHCPQVVASVVVTAATRLLPGAEVELVLLHGEGPSRYADAARAGAPTPPWALRALGATGIVTGVVTGKDDARPALSAVVGPSDAPLAVLGARRPAGAAGFGRRDVRVVELLVVQAVAWLSVAQPSTPSPSSAPSATAPALTALRESADRLARLADSPAGVEHIVDELRRVEQAVASLLGAVALAAEPDLLHLPEPHDRRRPEPASDWTTTGVLQ